MNALEKRLAAGSVKYELLDNAGKTLVVCRDLDFARQLQDANPGVHMIREIRCLKPSIPTAESEYSDTDCCAGQVQLTDPHGTMHTVWGEGGVFQTLVELFLLLDEPTDWAVLGEPATWLIPDACEPENSDITGNFLHSVPKLGKLTWEILGHLTPENAEFALMLLKCDVGHAELLENLITAEWSANVAAYTHDPICNFCLDKNGIPFLTAEHLKSRYSSVLGYFFLEALDDFALSIDCQNLQDQALASQSPAEILRIVLKLCNIGSYEFYHPYSAAKLYLTGSL